MARGGSGRRDAARRRLQGAGGSHGRGMAPEDESFVPCTAPAAAPAPTALVVPNKAPRALSSRRKRRSVLQSAGAAIRPVGCSRSPVRRPYVLAPTQRDESSVVEPSGRRDAISAKRRGPATAPASYEGCSPPADVVVRTGEAIPDGRRSSGAGRVVTIAQAADSPACTPNARARFTGQ